MTRKDVPIALVVDDEEGVRVFLEMVLSELGCEVETAGTMNEARRRIKESPRPDLVLLDKNLPDGSGLDLLEESKGHDPDLEIVMITGYASMESVVMALRFGAGDFLSKPFDELPLLAGKLQNALERARRARERTRLMADLKERERNLEAEVAQRTSELQKALEELKSRDLERRKSMANVGHDLRAPLTALQGYIEMFMRGKVEEARKERSLRTMFSQCRRLHRLSEDVVFLARLADGRVEWRMDRIETKELVGNAVAEMELHFDLLDVNLEWSVEEGVDSVWGDADRLMQVLTNLIGNAAKHAPAESTVRLTAGTLEESVVISVSDEGDGVSSEYREAVFERYNTCGAPGRSDGIGLSICRDIVLAHGGRVWVEDSASGGALFKVLLPKAESAATLAS